MKTVLKTMMKTSTSRGYEAKCKEISDDGDNEYDEHHIKTVGRMMVYNDIWTN